MTFRELVFEMGGDTHFPEHTTYILTHEGLVEHAQAIHVTGDVAWEMNQVLGKPSALDELRGIIARPTIPPILSREVVGEGPGWLTYCVRRARPGAGDPVSVEHIVHDELGGGAMIRRTVRRGVVEHAIGSEDGDGIQRVYEAVGDVANNDAEMTLRLVRVGDYRPSLASAAALSAKSLSTDDRDLLRVALESGYYDEPKRCGVRELGDNLGFSKSVIARKLRGLERRALEAFLTTTPGAAAARTADSPPAPTRAAPVAPTPPAGLEHAMRL